MLFKESNTRIEAGFEKTKQVSFFNKIIEATISDLERNCENIGDGKTADVKVYNLRNTICLKVVDKEKIKKNEVFLTNNVNDEIEYLDKLSDPEFLKSIGLEEPIVPKPMFSKEDKRYSFLFMEKIKGRTLKDLEEENSYSALPKNFNWTAFFDKLENIIKKLNENKIFHRDLHEGNIFVTNIGEPILIDFGDAYESFLTDENPYHEEGPGGEKTGIIKYHEDPEMIKKLRTKFSSIKLNK